MKDFNCKACFNLRNGIPEKNKKPHTCGSLRMGDVSVGDTFHLAEKENMIWEVKALEPSNKCSVKMTPQSGCAWFIQIDAKVIIIKKGGA